MMRLAPDGRPLVRCPACLHPCAADDANDEVCQLCGDVHMVTRDAADDWQLRTTVPLPEAP